MEENKNDEFAQSDNELEQIGGAAKNKAKEVARDAERTIGKAVKKAIKTGIQHLITFLLANPIVLGIILIVGFFFAIFNWAGSLLEFSIDTNSKLPDTISTLIAGKITVENTESPDGEYYIKISDDLIDSIIEEINTNEDYKDIKLAEIFGAENYKDYLYEMIKAQIASTSLKYSDYEDEEKGIIQGVIEVQRKDYEGNLQTLQYIPKGDATTEGTFDYMVAQKDEDVLNYYTSDIESHNIYYATKSSSTTINYGDADVNETAVDEETAATVPSGASESSREENSNISPSSVSYNNIAAQYGMNYSFLLSLLQVSQNIEWVMKVADLTLNDSKIVLMLQENYSHSESVSVDDYKRHEIIDVYEEYTTTHYDPVSRTSRTETHERQTETGKEVDTYEQRNITKTISDMYSTTAYISYANTWCMKMSQEYEKVEDYGETKDPVINVTEKNEEESTNSGERTASAKFGDREEYEAHIIWLDHKESNVTTSYSYKVQGEASKDVNTDMFLGLLKNKTGKYVEYYKRDSSGNVELDSDGNPVINEDAKFDKDGIYVKYTDIKGTMVSPMEDNLLTGFEMLLEILNNREENQQITLILRYMWYILTGDEKLGIKEFDFSTFDLTTFSGVSGGGSELLKEYVRYFENSGGAPTNAAGTCYIMETDGYGHPTIGYGVDVYNGGFEQDFINAGYSMEIGAEVPIEFVDALEAREMQDCMEQIRSITSGLNLKEYQIHALVSRAYNCGVGTLTSQKGAIAIRNGKNFIEAYNAYWNEDTDDLYESGATQGDFNHSLYTTYMNKPVTSDGEYSRGLEVRRKSEWTLFQTGYYDTINKRYSPSSATGNLIVETAMKYVGNPYVNGGSSLTSGCDCSHFVWLVLKECGAIPSSASYFSTSSMDNGVQSNWGAVKVGIDPSLAQPGDIILYGNSSGIPHHAAIYAGNSLIVEAKGSAYGITADRNIVHGSDKILGIYRITKDLGNGYTQQYSGNLPADVQKYHLAIHKEFIEYNQGDYTTSSVEYIATSEKGPLGKKGCCPTSIAIIMSGLGIKNSDGIAYTPETLVTSGVKNAYNGSSYETAKIAFNNVGLNVGAKKYTNSAVNQQNMLDELNAGHPLLAHISEGVSNRVFSESGAHYVAVIDVNGTQVYVSNANKARKTGWVELSIFLQSCDWYNAVWK